VSEIGHDIFFITANLPFACYANLYLRLLQLWNSWCSGM